MRRDVLNDCLTILVGVGLIWFAVTLSACSDGLVVDEGKQGPAPTVTMTPASTTECSNGGVVLTVGSQTSILCNGDIGPTGDVGPTGPQGTTGPDGLDGTQITEVQFCPGDTTYPSQFNEIGFCIEGRLYAVYSQNGGFLTYVPPGTYTSNGINSSCTFTVGANCEIK